MKRAVTETNGGSGTPDADPPARTDAVRNGATGGWISRLHRLISWVATRNARGSPDRGGRREAHESSGRRSSDPPVPMGPGQRDGPPLDLDDVFEVLRNRRRRDILRHLDSETNELQLGTMAEVIAARECDTEPNQVTAKQRKRVYTALYQCHLPKMDEVDAIEYDSRSGRFEPGPAFRVFHHYLPVEETVTGPSATDT